MAQYFLAGVANAEIFDENDQLFATAKTLTDSSINVTVSAEEVRGGEGAALRGKYFHTSGLTLQMTDAMFNLSYIAANVGADLKVGADVMFQESFTADTTGEKELSKTARPLGCDDSIYAWITVAGKDNWTRKDVLTGNKIKDLDAGTKYCVKYIANEASANSIKVNTNFVPKTLYVILTAALFAGDAKANVGTKVGSVVIKVPRFQLDGQQDLSMTMTGASNTSFSGSALAVECTEECETNAYYAEIIEVLSNANWASDAISLAVDQAIRQAAPGDTVAAPDVYAVYAAKLPKKIDQNALSSIGNATLAYAQIGTATGSGFEISETTGVVTLTSEATGTGTFEVSLKDNQGALIDDLQTTFTISVPTA